MHFKIWFWNSLPNLFMCFFQWMNLPHFAIINKLMRDDAIYWKNALEWEPFLYWVPLWLLHQNEKEWGKNLHAFGPTNSIIKEGGERESLWGWIISKMIKFLLRGYMDDILIMTMIVIIPTTIVNKMKRKENYIDISIRMLNMEWMPI